MTGQEHTTATPSDLDAAASRALSDVLARMGSDPCIYSVDLAIDEIATELTTTHEEHAAVRSLLRSQVGLTVEKPTAGSPSGQAIDEPSRALMAETRARPKPEAGPQAGEERNWG